MQILQETTDDWKASYRVPLHTYYVEGTKLVAYIREGTTTPVVFATPMRFDKRGRSFRVLRGPKLRAHKPATVKVQGSKGAVYEVLFEGNTPVSCSCPGFTYRGQCKHLALAKLPGSGTIHSH